MSPNKFVLVVLAIVTATLSGCVIVPPRAYVASPGIYVQPAPYWGYGYEHRGRRY